LLLLQLAFKSFKLLLLLINLSAHLVILLSELSHCNGNFFFLLSTELPTWNHVVWLEKRSCGDKIILRLIFLLPKLERLLFAWI
jgi:hypothetical protein